jgi:hypothetical protein
MLDTRFSESDPRGNSIGFATGQGRFFSLKVTHFTIAPTRSTYVCWDVLIAIPTFFLGPGEDGGLDRKDAALDVCS